MQFLRALAASPSGQTYESLEWAGENLLKLGEAREAVSIFKEKILDKMNNLPENQRFRTAIKLATAYRKQQDFTEADRLVKALREQYPNALEPMIEEGLLKEARAAAKQGKR